MWVIPVSYQVSAFSTNKEGDGGEQEMTQGSGEKVIYSFLQIQRLSRKSRMWFQRAKLCAKYQKPWAVTLPCPCLLCCVPWAIDTVSLVSMSPQLNDRSDLHPSTLTHRVWVPKGGEAAG